MKIFILGLAILAIEAAPGIFPNLSKLREMATSGNSSLLQLLQETIRNQTTFIVEVPEKAPMVASSGLNRLPHVVNPHAIMTSSKASDTSLDAQENSSPVSNLFGMLPQFNNLRFDPPPVLGRIAGATAMGALAIGAILASPGIPGLIRRSDPESKKQDVPEESWLDSLKFWEKSSDGADTKDSPDYAYNQYDYDPYYDIDGRPTYTNDAHDEELYQSDTTYDNYDWPSQRSEDQETYNVQDSYTVGDESNAYSNRVKNPRERKQKRRKVDRDDDKSPKHRQHAASKPELQKYVTVEEVNRLADESLSDIMQHYEGIRRNRDRNEDEPQDFSYTDSMDTHSDSGAQYQDPLHEGSDGWETGSRSDDWYPIADPALLKNHQITNNDDGYYEDSQNFRRRKLSDKSSSKQKKTDGYVEDSNRSSKGGHSKIAQKILDSSPYDY